MTARFASNEPGLPIEQFIQALTSQLDRAQTALAMKARAGMPLTFALKDLTLDLRAHVDVSGSVVRIRPAGPGETESSTLRIALTTITRPMMEENTQALAGAVGEPTLGEVLGNQLSEDELRRLEWAGVRTVAQLQDLEQHAGSDALERVAQVPAMRLRAALARASHPFVTDVSTVVPPATIPERQATTPPAFAPADERAPGDQPIVPPLIRVRGHNLLREGMPSVRIRGEAVPVLEASRRELLLAPLAHQLGGMLEIETEPGMFVTHDLEGAVGATMPAGVS